MNWDEATRQEVAFVVSCTQFLFFNPLWNPLYLTQVVVLCMHATCCYEKLEQKRSRGSATLVTASLVDQMVKNLPAVQETKVLSLGQEDS